MEKKIPLVKGVPRRGGGFAELKSGTLIDEMRYITYPNKLKKFSRELRNKSTLSEVLLWNELKQSKMIGYKFNRQKPLENYIVDFYCRPLKLVIEIDGCTHDNEEAYLNDLERQNVLESMELSFLRFDDKDIKHNLENVLGAIRNFIIAETSNAANPPLAMRVAPPLQGGFS